MLFLFVGDVAQRDASNGTVKSGLSDVTYSWRYVATYD